MASVPCPSCGQEATLLPDGAIYCRNEDRIVPRGVPADVALARSRAAEPARRPRDTVADAHWQEAAQEVSDWRANLRAFGIFNLVLFVFVALTLVAAIAGFVLVFLA
jgi:hypothetical protein